MMKKSVGSADTHRGSLARERDGATLLRCREIRTYVHKYHKIATPGVTMADSTATQQVKEFVKERGMVRRRDVENEGLPTRLLYRLRDRGELIQLAPGLFAHPDSEITEKHTYAEAAKRVPRGVVCLTSALAFHDIGVQLPRRVWMALNREEGRARPRVKAVPVEFVWFSGDAFEEGQETHRVQRVSVRVYNPAKTVADLFKFRNKVGVDIAIEALQEGWRDRLFTMDELDHYADICRVSDVIRPYLQSLVASS
ncbi:MAG: type IV toxin-antitoxin system AbiEi family antitoxin domain-containing protein [Gemmatimonadota bacterium]